MGTDQCPFFGVERCPLLGGLKCISFMVKSIGASEPSVVQDCPLFGGSAIRSFTVIDPSINLSDLNLWLKYVCASRLGIGL